MSFCNPANINDYLQPAPTTDNNNLKEGINAASGTPPGFNPVEAGAETPPPNTLTPADTKSLHDKVIQAASQMQQLSNYFGRIGFDAASLEAAYTNIVGKDGSVSIRQFFTNIAGMTASLGDLEDNLGKALGIDSTTWFKQLRAAQEQTQPFIAYANKLGQFINNGAVIGDDFFVSLFTDLSDLADRTFGPDNGFAKAIHGIADFVSTASGVINYILEAESATEDAAIAAFDMAESLMATGLALAAAICDFIPAFIAMARAIIEGIMGLIDALLHFDLSKIKLDIDFSKLFKLPSIDLFRKLKDRWDRFAGNAFKLWQTTAAECSPEHWDSVLNGPGRVSEAAGSLSKALGLGAQLATAAADAPEGISKIDTNLLSRITASANKSLVHVRPAVVSSNPSVPELAWKSGTSIPADLSSVNLPHGLGSLNGSKAHEIHPETGLPIRPGVFSCVSNNLESMSDLCGIVRAGELAAANSYVMGRSIKDALQPGASHDTQKQALSNSLEATRRMRYSQSAITSPDGSKLSPIAEDYYACAEKAQSRKHPVANTGDALNHMSNVFNQPAGLPGSVLERASINNPTVFANADNHTAATNANDTINKNTPPPNTTSPSSIIGKLTPGNLYSKVALTDPNAVITSPASDAVDKLIAKMPFAAMGEAYYDTSFITTLTGLLKVDEPNLKAVPMYMLCKDSSQSNRLNVIVNLQTILEGVDPAVAEGLYQKALIQGLLDNNSYTWLAIGKRLSLGTSFIDQIQAFLMHSRADIRPLYNWLKSSANQNIKDPALPLNLTPKETDLAAKSFKFLQSNSQDLGSIILDLRQQADDTGGPMGYEFAMFLVVENILKQVEARILNGENMSEQLKKLQPLVTQLTFFPALSQQVNALIKGKY